MICFNQKLCYINLVCCHSSVIQKIIAVEITSECLFISVTASHTIGTTIGE